MNSENERGAVQGASLTDQNLLLISIDDVTGDAAVVNYGGVNVRPPPGAGYEHDGELAPIVSPPSYEERKINQHRIALMVEVEALLWARQDAAKFSVVDFWSGRDRRPLKEIIETAGCSPRTFYRYLEQLRAFTVELQGELEKVGGA